MSFAWQMPHKINCVSSNCNRQRLQARPNIQLTPSLAVLSTGTQNYLSHHQKEDADVNQLLKDFLYVDNFAGGAGNNQEAI